MIWRRWGSGIVVFTVTCLEKNGLAGLDFILFFFFFQLECTFLAVIKLHQHKFCIDKGKRQLNN